MNNKTSRIIFSNIVFLSLIITIILYLNYILKIKTYILAQQFFWQDEMFLLLNVQQGNFLDFFSVLKNGQCCPPVFLILAKILYHLFGLNEHVLRALPMYASILSTFAFMYLTFLIFKKRISILFANILFSLSLPLNYYTLEFKHYSFDCLATIIILITAVKIKDVNLNNWQILILSILYICLFFTSYISLLILITAMITIISYKFIKTNNIINFKHFIIQIKSLKLKNFIPTAIFVIPFGFVFLIYFFHTLLPTMLNPMLQDFWEGMYGNDKNIFFTPFLPEQFIRLSLFFIGIDKYVVSYFMQV